MALIGYVRISSSEQKTDLQYDALAAAGVKKIFEDVGVSGSVAVRAGLTAALDFLRDGDQLVTFRLDRLGRNTLAVLELLQDLERRGVAFRSITEGLDSSTPAGRMLQTLLISFATMEREILIERTNAGLRAARERGRIGGRPRALSEAKVELARVMFKRGSSAIEIGTELGCSRSVVYRALQLT
ncbi:MULTISPECIES: recombinase family protein [unclassified Cryobacterium]|uniref:recombinase family protein n=1 Tax=unclassified Cryobacterium TaxID=2649013 RepID=UPI001069F979|nr:MULTISPECIES: recombinase family protein [unclassified Cryobacterium]TFB96287.1 recombinase family protein [Cryobacterium sp. MDB2-A-1]TFC12572.1 recombinase family protein [Cryobacterium sp. MDB2-A-2]